MKHTWIKTVVATIALSSAGFVTTSASAGLLEYSFAVNGFAGGGTLSGSFIGEDTNNDGYISSFPFSYANEFDNTVPNTIQSGLNEVSFASATFTAGANSSLSSFNVKNDLTDLSDILSPEFPLLLDAFFILNYKIGSGFIGDDSFEGMLLGEANQPYVFGLGQFLPAPDTIFAGTFGNVEGDPDPLINGNTLTSELIRNAWLIDGPGPCTGMSTCGVVHDVLFPPAVGSADFTNSFAVVIEGVPVSAPGTSIFIAASLLAFALSGKETDWKKYRRN